MQPLLAVENLRVAFRSLTGLTEVLRGVSLEVHQGKVLGLVGESGAGKSILARSIFGLLDESALITEGRVLFAGQDLVKLPGKALRQIRGKRLALIPAGGRAALNPMLPIGKQLINVYRAHHPRESLRQVRERVVDMLKAVGISDPVRRLNAYPHELSGGMAQRVLIASALINSPEFIVADEPTGSLDVTIQAQILKLVRELVRQHRTAMLLISRDLGVIAHLSDEIAVIKSGEVIECAPRQKLLTSPEHIETASLIEAFSDKLPSHISADL